MTSSQRGCPKLPFTYSEWLQQTSRKSHWRSKELGALDVLIHAYGRTRSESNLRLLKIAFRRWCEAQGPGNAWMASVRNDTQELPFVKLNAALFEHGDHDAALGAPSFMHDDLVHSRLGLLYLFSHIECRSGYFSLSTQGVLDLSGAGMVLAGAELGGDTKKQLDDVKTGIDFIRPGVELGAKHADRRLNRTAQPKPLNNSGTFGPASAEAHRVVDGAKLLDMKTGSLTPVLKAHSEKMYEKLKGVCNEVFGDWDKYTASYARKLCDLLIMQLESSVSGVVGGSFGGAGGLLRLIESSLDKYRVWAIREQVSFLSGTPTAIVNGINKAMDFAIGRDLYKTLKGGAQLGMKIASAGASAIVNLITSIVELLLRATWKLYETEKLRTFVKEAKAHWQQRYTERLQSRPIAFNAWFSGYAHKLPIVPALALNSSVCHHMHFLQMFSSGNELITQSQYDAGVAMMRQLKDFSSKYISESGYVISSGDGVVSEWLKPAERADHNAWSRHAMNSLKGFFS